MELELYYDGEWRQAPVRSGSGVRVMRGVRTRGDSDPSSASLVVDNSEVLHSPRAVSSALYGKIRQNTPARVSVDGSVRLTGEGASWVPSRPIKGSGWTDLQVAGVLQRIGRGTDPLQPALTRAVQAAGVDAYWPLDDPRDSTEAASGIGGLPLSMSGAVGFAEYTNTLGISQAPNMGTGSLSGTVPNAASPAHQDVTFSFGFGLRTLIYPLSSPETEPPLLSFYTPGSTGEGWARWDITLGIIEWGEVTVKATQGNGTIIFSTFQLNNQSADWYADQWHYYEFEVSYNAATDAYTIIMYADGEHQYQLTTTTYVGAIVGGCTAVRVNPDHYNWGTFGVSGLYVKNGPCPFLGAAFTGHTGETAADRFARLCLEHGIAATVVGDPAESVAMGPQRALTLLQLLDEVGRTDDASIFETRDSIGLTMRTGQSKLNQSVALTLSYLGDIVPNLRPVYGDEGIRNDATATAPSGAWRRVQQFTGPHNVQAPEDDPRGVGRYTTRVEANPETDAALSDAAGWRVNQGTYDGTWYATVTAELDAAPGITAAVAAIDIGDLIALTSLPVDEALDTVELLVIGIGEDIGEKRRTVTFYCVPADPYRVGILAADSGDTDPFLGRLDTDDSTVPATVPAGASSFSVTTNSGPLWTTAADDFPFDVVVGGQRVSVSTIGFVVNDAFGSRTLSGTWSNEPTSGVAYVLLGSGSDYAVASGVGTMTIGSANSFRGAVLDVSASDKAVVAQSSLNVASPAGAAITRWICGRYLDANNYWCARLDVTTAGNVTLGLFKRVGGTLSSALGGGSVTVGTSHASGELWRVRVEDFGNIHSVYAWKGTLADRPTTPQITYTDPSNDVPLGTSFGLLIRREASNTDSGLVVSWDNVMVTNPQKFTVQPSGFQVLYPIPAGSPVNVHRPIILTL